ncbi:hypothetical protein [Holospora elegans]|uniref:hypothetical protein n=1 Tax=Holospora elegans TaxID=431043 RepID=UPI000551DA7A|nr:hypothetical protein [Holospora elegans]
MNIRITYKSGFFPGIQRYKCKKCGKNFTRCARKDKLKAFVLYARGLSMKRIAQHFGVGATAVLKGRAPYNQSYAPKLSYLQKTKVLSRKLTNFGII